jgi:hypothetical protein
MTIALGGSERDARPRCKSRNVERLTGHRTVRSGGPTAAACVTCAPTSASTSATQRGHSGHEDDNDDRGEVRVRAKRPRPRPSSLPRRARSHVPPGTPWGVCHYINDHGPDIRREGHRDETTRRCYRCDCRTGGMNSHRDALMAQCRRRELDADELRLNPYSPVTEKLPYPGGVTSPAPDCIPPGWSGVMGRR